MNSNKNSNKESDKETYSESNEQQRVLTRKTKKEYRKIYRNRRNQLTPEEVDKKSRVICRKIAELPEFMEADAILSYMAFRNEVDMKQIMLTSREKGKKIFLPRMEGEEMEFYLADREEELVKNSLGIEEPAPSAPVLSEIMPKGSRILMLMPGLAYDRSNHRLGYGGGYYDKYLAKKGKDYTIITVAPAYELSIDRENDFPSEETDIRPQIIIHE